MVLPTLLYGVEGWGVSKTIARYVKEFEGGLLRKVARLRKNLGEDMMIFMARTTKQARRIYFRLGHKTAECQLLSRCWRWAGRVAKRGNLRYEFVHGVLCHKSEAAWRTTNETWRSEAQKPKRQCFRETWMHRTGWHKVTTFECWLIYSLGVDWRSLASNAQEWAAMEDRHIIEVLSQWRLDGARRREQLLARLHRDAGAEPPTKKRRIAFEEACRWNSELQDTQPC